MSSLGTVSPRSNASSPIPCGQQSPKNIPPRQTSRTPTPLVFETQTSLPANFAQHLVRVLEEDPTLGSDPARLQKIFERFSETLSQQLKETHQTELDEATQAAERMARLRYDARFKILEAFDENAYENGVQAGKSACADNHPQIIAAHIKALPPTCDPSAHEKIRVDAFEKGFEAGKEDCAMTHLPPLQPRASIHTHKEVEPQPPVQTRTTPFWIAVSGVASTAAAGCMGTIAGLIATVVVVAAEKFTRH